MHFIHFIVLYILFCILIYQITYKKKNFSKVFLIIIIQHFLLRLSITTVSISLLV
jgi:hypothetical protein